VRKVTGECIIRIIAGNGATVYSGDGGPAFSASFSAAATGIAVDAGDTVYVADIYNNVIRALVPPLNMDWHRRQHGVYLRFTVTGLP
jgi:hypothetical protein